MFVIGDGVCTFREKNMKFTSKWSIHLSDLYSTLKEFI